MSALWHVLLAFSSFMVLLLATAMLLEQERVSRRIGCFVVVVLSGAAFVDSMVSIVSA